MSGMGRRWWVGRVAVVLVMALSSWAGLAVSVWGAGEPEERPPIGDDNVLSRAQMRYCDFELVRIKTAQKFIEANKDSVGSATIQAVNWAIDDWNSRCLSYRFLGSDKKAVESELAAAHERLQTEGRDMERWRRAHGAVMYHVTANSLNLREGPGIDRDVVAKLTEFQTVEILGPAQGDWIPVQVGEERGFASTSHVARGSGGAARRAYCAGIAGVPPGNGEILYGSATGDHVVEVNNGLNEDALIKLRTNENRTALSFFVLAGRTVETTGVPDGNYRLMFAAGEGYSRGCKRFLGKVYGPEAFDTYNDFQTQHDGNKIYTTHLRITLHPVEGGNARTSEVDAPEANFWED